MINLLALTTTLKRFGAKIVKIPKRRPESQYFHLKKYGSQFYVFRSMVAEMAFQDITVMQNGNIFLYSYATDKKTGRTIKVHTGVIRASMLKGVEIGLTVTR